MRLATPKGTMEALFVFLEAMFLLPIAIALDVVQILMIFGVLDDYFLTSIIGFIIFAPWTILRIIMIYAMDFGGGSGSGAKELAKKTAKTAKKATGKAAKKATKAAAKTGTKTGGKLLGKFLGSKVGSMIPIIKLMPWWTLLVLSELVPTAINLLKSDD